MNKKAISISHKMKGLLDDDYTLYDDGTILHEYDKHTYPGGQNLIENLTQDNFLLSTFAFKHATRQRRS